MYFVILFYSACFLINSTFANFDRGTMPMNITLIIRKIAVEAITYAIHEIDKVEFYIDGELKSVDCDKTLQLAIE